jgi:hypothetical protein
MRASLLLEEFTESSGLDLLPSEVQDAVARISVLWYVLAGRKVIGILLLNSANELCHPTTSFCVTLSHTGFYRSAGERGT